MKQLPYDVVIFDIDNVLIDTRASYTDCIRHTVQYYLEKKLGYRRSNKLLLSRRDVEQFKWLGGFNDDWDTSYAILLYLLSLTPKIKSVETLRPVIKIETLARKTKRPLHVSGIERLCGKVRAVSISKIARIFQQLYWSRFIRYEKPLLKKKWLLALLKRKVKIAIATGRSMQEAHVALKQAGIYGKIAAITSLDHIPHNGLKKPHPYSLVSIAKKLGRDFRYLYIGDLPDDICTAKRAASQMRVEAWGACYAAVNRSKAALELKRAGAKKILKNPSDFFNALV